MKYVVHYCKNPLCDNCWMDEDLTNAKSRPPKWKYCPNCVKIGYTNPGKPILKQYQKKKIELMNKAKKERKMYN